jgi:hypothetical protein
MKLNVEFAAFLGQNNLDRSDTNVNSSIVESVLKDVISQMRSNCESAERNIWMLSHQERQQIIGKWASEVNYQAIAEKIVDIHLKHQDALAQLRLARQDIDMRCLEKQQVIGLTTSACASNWDLLSRLNLQVVICEEAGEVMEAHTLCTLFPSMEHAIFIGDPLQLRLVIL